ncbi:MAG: nitrogenase component 1, partial [Halobacteriales archaeon]
VLMYPETAESAARWMERELGLPFTKTVPIGVGATRDFLQEIGEITGLPAVLGDTLIAGIRADTAVRYTLATRGEEDEMVETVGENYGGEVHIAEDMQTIEVKD